MNNFLEHGIFYYRFKYLHLVLIGGKKMPLFLLDKTKNTKEKEEKGEQQFGSHYIDRCYIYIYIHTYIYMIGKFSSPKRYSQPGRDLACLGNSQTVYFSTLTCKTFTDMLTSIIQTRKILTLVMAIDYGGSLSMWHWARQFYMPSFPLKPLRCQFRGRTPKIPV